ncbi:MAG: 5-oxoprolinase subunit PxpB [Acidobacteria bacterium]|nr:5-oxoprolinase subunit PxpB [Acidobacteriota bacterium]
MADSAPHVAGWYLSPPEPVITPASDCSLLVCFGEQISLASHRRVRGFLRRFAAPGVVNLHPAYASVLISFDPLRTSHAELAPAARAAAAAGEPEAESRLVEIPVLYGGEFGPDLAGVAALNGLTPEQVIAIHSSAEYTVCFLGFSPGFPYLGGLPEAIATPRLAAPRKLVPAGSVAIGGSQAGIYPAASPGGWRILGRTPLELFRADREPPALLEMGDRVRFVEWRP